MESGRSHLACLGTWVLLHTLRTMIQYLFSGFELTLYSIYEYHYIFWLVPPMARSVFDPGATIKVAILHSFSLLFQGIYTSFCTVGLSPLTTEPNASWMNINRSWSYWRARARRRGPVRREAKAATANLKGRRRKATRDLTLKKLPTAKLCRACAVDITR